MNAEKRIAELKLELPPAPKPVAVYKPVVVVDRMAYVSGHGPLKPDKTLMTGRLGGDLNVEQGKAAARQVGLAILATLPAHGLLGRVKRVVKIGGFVNVTPDFAPIPQVMNGCSDLMVQVFGDAGRHARSAVGVANLPLDFAVEADGIFEIE